jgi:hypothetical protein
LGASSRGEVKFGLGVILAVVFSIAYGSILVGENGGGAAQHGGFNLKVWSWLTVFAGVMLFIMHAAERYERHVYNEEPFYEFRDS